MASYKVDMVCYGTGDAGSPVSVQLLADSEANAVVEAVRTVISQIAVVIVEVKGVKPLVDVAH